MFLLQNKMLDYSNNSRLGGIEIISAPYNDDLSPCPSTESLLNTRVVGAPSARGLFQRRRSVSLFGGKLSQNQFINRLNADPSVFSGGSNNKENRVCERSFSELGDRPGSLGSVLGSGQVNSSRYKTELCRPFKEHGVCKYGDKCQFAHGMHELRNLSRHPKYKTELCRTFHTIGYCPYGPRCHFIHNADECRGPPPLGAFNKTERPRLQHSFSFAGFPSADDLQSSPTSVTPPPPFSSETLTEWQSNPFTYSSQEFASLFSPSLGSPPSSEPQGPAQPSVNTPCFFQAASESPPSAPSPPSPSSPPDSVSDQEGYQSSQESQSGSESPLLDASRRLPIFSTLSVSDD